MLPSGFLMMVELVSILFFKEGTILCNGNWRNKSCVKVACHDFLKVHMIIMYAIVRELVGEWVVVGVTITCIAKAIVKIQNFDFVASW